MQDMTIWLSAGAAVFVLLYVVPAVIQAWQFSTRQRGRYEAIHRPPPPAPLFSNAMPPGDEGSAPGVQMQPIKVNTERVDKTVHHVVLDQAQLEALILDAVAKAAGVVVDRRVVRVRRCDLSSRMGSIGSEYSATCTIEVDHQAVLAAVIATESAPGENPIAMPSPRS